MAAPNRMNFRKSSKGGGGSFSIQKFMLQILGTINKAFWAWNWYKRVVSGFGVCFFNNCIEKNQNKAHFEDRLEFSRKFIRFGAAILPLVCPDPSLSELTRVVFETRPICFQSKGLLLFAFDMSSPIMGIMMMMCGGDIKITYLFLFLPSDPWTDFLSNLRQV